MINIDKIKVKIFKYDPSKDERPRYDTYEVPYFQGMRVLDAIIYIVDILGEDIAFRWSCGSGRCGTCGALVNGEPKLMCWEPAENEMTIEPLPYFPIIRDLVIDRKKYDENILMMNPFLERVKPPEKFPEDIKHDENVAIMDRLGECIHCLSCISACPLLKRVPTWIGPKGLVTLARYATDPRDKGDKPSRAYNEGLFYCSVCGKCEKVCSKEIAIPDLVMQRVRALSVEEAHVPPTIRDALEGVFKHGNPWGLSRSKRSDWAKNLKVKYVSENEKVDLLYYVGCAASYEYRAQDIARVLVKNLNDLRIDFSILGNEENCCGNEVYSLGEEGLFEILVEDNLNILDRYSVNKIITTSPHCYNVFKNRYGKELDVQHYTQYFSDLVDRGNLKFSRKVEKVVTYHDPCFLGRHNNIYDEPRKIIESIPGTNFIELESSRERSICCEGGGGRMWYEIPGERLAENRIREAIEIGAEILAVACPFCLLTLDDAVKTTNNEDLIQVMDIMELFSRANSNCEHAPI